MASAGIYLNGSAESNSRHRNRPYIRTPAVNVSVVLAGTRVVIAGGDLDEIIRAWQRQSRRDSPDRRAKRHIVWRRRREKVPSLV
jgi:hypothetical protein